MAESKTYLLQEGTTDRGESLPEHCSLEQSSGCPSDSGGGKFRSKNINTKTKNPKSNLTQQIFHKGLFINRPRSNSYSGTSSEAPVTNTQTLEALYVENAHKNDQNDTQNWQKENSRKRLRSSPETTSRTQKQTKLSYWLAAPVPTSNMFAELAIPEETKAADQVTRHIEKPPPFFVDKVSNIQPLSKMLEDVAHEDYEIKILQGERVKIQAKSPESYSTIYKELKSRNTEFFTYQPKGIRGSVVNSCGVAGLPSTASQVVDRECPPDMGGTREIKYLARTKTSRHGRAFSLIFHKGLFINRPRSNSYSGTSSEAPVTNTQTLEALYVENAHKNDQNDTQNWQKENSRKRLRSSPETTSRTQKQTKLSYWLAAPVPTSNMFAELAIPEETKAADQVTRHIEKPPPFFVDKVSNIQPLSKMLEDVAHEDYEIKILQGERVKIQAKSPESYSTIYKELKSRNTEFFTYQPKEAAQVVALLDSGLSQRVVARTLHLSLFFVWEKSSNDFSRLGQSRREYL
ncbi:unnamed protein product [Spodoptera exigua]|nr:unnamed protein product [Spodoptera exigua]